jgi:quinol monooxygenase YgiN
MRVLNVTYRFKDDNGEDFYEAILAEGLDEAARNEEGNIKYDFYTPANGDDELLLVEKWKDTDAFEKHCSEPHFKRFGELKEEYGVESQLEIFDI